VVTKIADRVQELIVGRSTRRNRLIGEREVFKGVGLQSTRNAIPGRRLSWPGGGVSPVVIGKKLEIFISRGGEGGIIQGEGVSDIQQWNPVRSEKGFQLPCERTIC